MVWRTLSVVVVTLWLTGCNVNVPPPPVVAAPPPPPPAPVNLPPGGLGLMPDASPAVDGAPHVLTVAGPTVPKPLAVNANNQFAFELYAQLRKQESGNLFCSPANIATALAMTYAGARGSTAEEMARVLHFAPSTESFHAEYGRKLAALRSDEPGRSLRLANRLWGADGESFLEEFLAVTRKHYGAEMARVDFVGQNERVREEINAWTASQTNDKIRDLIPAGDLDPGTRLILTSAVHFRGDWLSKFDPQRTKPEPFQVSSEEKIDTPLMNQHGAFLTGLVDGVHLVELPYVGLRQSMVVLMPEKQDGFAEFEAKLTAENVRKWTERMSAEELDLALPKFTLTQSFSLGEALQALGMTAPFDASQADFSGIAAGPGLYISSVLHKAFVDVNEEGTEAAAATAVRMMRGFSPPPVFRADRPFVYLIRDQETGDVLFLGRFARPASGE